MKFFLFSLLLFTDWKTTNVRSDTSLEFLVVKAIPPARQGSCTEQGTIAVGVNTLYICTPDTVGGQSWSKVICCLTKHFQEIRMLLKPVTNPINTILQSAGVLQTSKDNTSKVSEVLNAQGLTLEYTAENLRELTCAGESAVRLRATEMSFKLHGALKDAEARDVPNITFIIQGDDSRLQTILTPRS